MRQFARLLAVLLVISAIATPGLTRGGGGGGGHGGGGHGGGSAGTGPSVGYVNGYMRGGSYVSGYFRGYAGSQGAGSAGAGYSYGGSGGYGGVFGDGPVHESSFRQTFGHCIRCSAELDKPAVALCDTCMVSANTEARKVLQQREDEAAAKQPQAQQSDSRGGRGGYEHLTPAEHKALNQEEGRSEAADRSGNAH